ncbi:hypothetical protein RCH20_000539 [Psychrobacter sp. PL15]|nr:hypothetical protein [Psychrobacter sp. PL15]
MLIKHNIYTLSMNKDLKITAILFYTPKNIRL